jgi:hypothetical protein
LRTRESSPEQHGDAADDDSSVDDTHGLLLAR